MLENERVRIADTLTQEARRQELSYYRLGQLTGLTVDTVIKVLSGKNCNLNSYLKVAAALKRHIAVV